MTEDNNTGICRRPGRPRTRRRIGRPGPWRCFAPQCQPDENPGSVYLRREEIELLRLIDLEGLEQEEAGTVLGVSRRTVWKDIHDARMKVVDALVNGKIIEIDDCSTRSEGSCPKENEDYCPKSMGLCSLKKNPGICRKH